MSTPYEKCRALHLEMKIGGMTWEELIGYALIAPDFYLFKSPDFFIMGRAVTKNANSELLYDFTHRFDPDKCNAWHVWALWGDLKKAWAAMPYELPWCAIQRHGVQCDLRFVSMASIARHIQDAS